MSNQINGNSHNRENEWFAKRMSIKTQAGMLRQYQMEEQERGYKIQTLEFKSPQYLLKNFISGNSPIRVIHTAPTKLRQMQGRHLITTALENVVFVSKSTFLFFARLAERGFSFFMAPAQARIAGLYCAAASALLLLIGLGTIVHPKASPAEVVASHHEITNTYSVVNHKQKRSGVASTQQKKFQTQIKSLL